MTADAATTNQQTVERYMEGFRRTDRAMILSCLTQDVEWFIPGTFHVHGHEAYAGHILDEGFAPHPEIRVTRMVESGDIVVAEGQVRAGRTDGMFFDLVFCDVFEMRGGKIRKLTSYVMMLPATESASG